MKTVNIHWLLFWIGLLLLAAIVVGRYIERVTALQDEVGDLNNRVNQLERQNVHREERRRLLSKAVGCIPFVKRLFRHE
jgi:hypothetical protein